MIENFEESSPSIGENVFIHPSSTIIGKVEIKNNANIWCGAVLRGDIEKITIGQNSNVQDNVVIHTSLGVETVIEDNVIIGHSASLHSCIIKEGTLIGIGSIVLDGVTIGRNCIVAAGSLVPPGKSFPDNSFILGSPAKIIKEVPSEFEKEHIYNVQNYITLSAAYLKKAINNI